jgi:hypothetical protein
MLELDPAPCTGTRPEQGSKAHCSTCYRHILPFDAASIRPRWRVIEARNGHPAAAACLSHIDRHALRHLHAIARPESPRRWGLVGCVIACVRRLFNRGGRKS